MQPKTRQHFWTFLKGMVTFSKIETKSVSDTTMIKPVLWIQIHLDPDPEFRTNLDPNPGPGVLCILREKNQNSFRG